MALLDCEVIPRRDATPEQLRALGGALADWARLASSDEGILHFISRFGLADLTNGNRPPPFLEQYQEMLNEGRILSGDAISLGAEQQLEERRRLKDVLGDDSRRQTLFFQVRCTYAERRQVANTLRDNIPAQLVDDVLVGDRSWDLV
jgi:hypothetical protein